MRPLRWVIVLCVLLQLSRAESQGASNEVTDDVDDLIGDEGSGAEVEDILGKETVVEADAEPEEEIQQPGEDFDEGEATGTPEWLDAELQWQRDMEDLEKQEEAMRDVDQDQVTDDDEHQDYLKEQYSQREPIEEEDDDNTYDEYLEKQRRLADQGSDQSADGNEEEEEAALPVVPGLTDVELFAFNAEFANEEVLDKIIDWSYDQVAGMSRFRDNYIHVEDLYIFLLKTLNPLDEHVDEEDEQILQDAVVELRKQQGLVDEEQVVYRGFIARGMPLRFLQSLAHDMHQTVQKRRLQTREEL